MSTGLGIFLASLVLGTVALYGITKDRWNWRIVGGISLVVIGIAGAVVYFWNDFRFPISKQTEYADLRLGMTRDQVKSIKGYPTSNVTPRDWSYRPVAGIGGIDLGFGPGETGLIVINCHSTDHYSNGCPAIAGIVDGSKEEEVIQKFGKPDIVRIAVAPIGGGAMNYLYYKNPGVHFWLEKGQVHTLGIGAPTPPAW